VAGQQYFATFLFFCRASYDKSEDYQNWQAK